jgi:hypothetical protein
MPGTYFVTSITTYTGNGGESGPTGLFERDTLVLTATGYAEALDIEDPDASPPTDTAVGGTYSATGAMLTFDFACPATGTNTVPYEASGRTLKYLSRGTSTADVYVFAGQF